MGGGGTASGGVCCWVLVALLLVRNAASSNPLRSFSLDGWRRMAIATKAQIDKNTAKTRSVIHAPRLHCVLIYLHFRGYDRIA